MNRSIIISIIAVFAIFFAATYFMSHDEVKQVPAIEKTDIERKIELGYKMCGSAMNSSDYDHKLAGHRCFFNVVETPQAANMLYDVLNEKFETTDSSLDTVTESDDIILLSQVDITNADTYITKVDGYDRLMVNFDIIAGNRTYDRTNCDLIVGRTDINNIANLYCKIRS